MGQRIYLYYSGDLPASPVERWIECLAREDRRSLGCRFGEPFDPRQLTKIQDVSWVVETYEDWAAHCGGNLNGTFADLDSWSGLLIQLRDGDHLMLVNPAHSRTRRTLTIAHEFGHLALGHRPILIENDVGMRENRYSDVQEREATAYGAALLLPYAPLLQMLRQGAPIRGIAHHYGVSVAAVEMRLKFTGLWGLQQR
jgi:IrrE N-terminal-like domain